MFPFEERVALWMFFLWFWCSHLRNVEPPCAPGWLQGPPGMGCLLMQVGINITFASDFAGLYNGKGGQLLSCFDLFWCGGRLKHWPGWMRQRVAGETTREHIWNYFETLETLKSPGSTFGRNQEWGTARVSQVGLQCQCWLNITTHTLEMFLFYRYKLWWTLQIEIYDFHLCRTTVSEFPDNRVYGWWIGATDLNRWVFHFDWALKWVAWTERAPGIGPTPLNQWTIPIGTLESPTTNMRMRTVPSSMALQWLGGCHSGTITTVATPPTRDPHLRCGGPSIPFVRNSRNKSFEDVLLI